MVTDDGSAAADLQGDHLPHGVVAALGARDAEAARPAPAGPQQARPRRPRREGEPPRARVQPGVQGLRRAHCTTTPRSVP